MHVVGLSAHYHDSACCLLRDGRLVAAAQEERFTRLKGEPRLPAEAYRYCLREAGLDPRQIDLVAYYELPELRRERQKAMGRLPDPEPDPVREIRELLGHEGPIRLFPHHASHAASAFLYSPFDSAAVLTADGVGEWATTVYWSGDGAALEALEEVRFPHSLGLLYSAVTAWLGFEVNRGEGTVMGLAGWGRPRRAGALRQLVTSLPGGGFRLAPDTFDLSHDRLVSPRLCELLGPPRPPGGELTEEHADVAASVQEVLEEILLEKLAFLRGATGSDDLCLAGGVALNCKANGRILEESGFSRLWVQPAAGDAGGALGAAALAQVEATGERPAPLDGVDLGPGFDPEPYLAATPLAPLDFRGRSADLYDEVARRLDHGEIVGWFTGRMELGPRALGQRSILADPRRAESRERLNREIKRREPFRPFAPAILEEAAAEVVETPAPSPHMLRSHPVRAERREELPAVTHVDGSARPQTVTARRTPRLAGLLGAWRRRTGCPALLNTSFNARGEPIVCTPTDALFALAGTGLDALVLEEWVVDAVPEAWPELTTLWRPPRQSPFRRDLYTF
ncbi:MAG: carbamoyltransferase N-terminal domain-containing protein [Thermoanaerobaculia bacterium]|nr:carbamoyltransferase N-terminal domain-containing protein [Thermoanaerobaculia bacterium]